MHRTSFLLSKAIGALGYITLLDLGHRETVLSRLAVPDPVGFKIPSLCRRNRDHHRLTTFSANWILGWRLTKPRFGLNAASFDALGLGSLVALCANQPAPWPRLAKFGLISIPLALILGLILLVYDRPWLSYVNETVVALALAYLPAKAAQGFGGLTGRLLSLSSLHMSARLAMAFISTTFLCSRRSAHFSVLPTCPPSTKGPCCF
jgi:hypothetical protein